MNNPNVNSAVPPGSVDPPELVVPPEMEEGHECDSAALNVAWVKVVWFKVSCKGVEEAKTRLYANGYQCVQIDVDIIAQNQNDEDVTLSPSQLNEIHLINYVGGGSVPHPYYVESFKKNDFIHDSPVQRQSSATDAGEQGVLQQGAQRRTLWVHTYGGVGSAMRLAARIVTPIGVAYTTNTPDPEPGKFNSSVTLQPMAPLVHRAGDLQSWHEFYGTVGQRDGYVFKATFKDGQYWVEWCNPHNLGDYFYIGKASGKRRYYYLPPYDARSVTLTCHHSSRYTFHTIPTRCLAVLMIADAHDDGPNRNGSAKAQVWDQYGNFFTVEWYAVNDGKQVALRDG